MYFLRLIVLLSLAGLALAGCSPQSLPQAPTSIPTLIPATLPAATAPGEVPGAETGGVSPEYAQGQEVWQTHCMACHRLTGEKLVGPGMAGLWQVEKLPNEKPFSEENLIEWIKTGGGAMPPFGSVLSDGEINAVVAFLKEETGAADVAEPATATTGEPQTAQPDVEPTVEEPAATMTEEPPQATQPAEASETTQPAVEPAVEEPAAATTGEPQTARSTEAPETAQPAVEPTAEPETAPQKESAGLSNKTFDKLCKACHDLADKKKIGPGLAGLFDKQELPNGSPMTEENLVAYLHTGGGAMPGFPKITGDEMDELIAFLKEATK